VVPTDQEFPNVFTSAPRKKFSSDLAHLTIYSQELAFGNQKNFYYYHLQP